MIPYELIGRFTVALLLAILLEIVVLTVVVLSVVVWWRFWSFVANMMWRGYDIDEGEQPPVWRRKIAIASIAIQERDREIWERGAEELLNDE